MAVVKTIYIDDEFKCHIKNDGTMTAIETSAFDGKCDTYIEGYRFIPEGESWTREDGVTFKGGLITPWKPYAELDAAQRKYEREQLAGIKESLNALIGGINDA